MQLFVGELLRRQYVTKTREETIGAAAAVQPLKGNITS